MQRAIAIAVSCGLLLAGCSRPAEDYTVHVNPFIGTQHEGHCFPGATVPMGMVQASPESTTAFHDGYCMDHVAGYQYDDPLLSGFAQTHVNGAGCPTLSDILLMPYCGRETGPYSKHSFESAYDKKSETATPGYYSVRLTDNHTLVELTATEHAAWHRYTFDSTDAAVLVDLQYGVAWSPEVIDSHVIEACDTIAGNSISGYRKANVWAERDLFYTIEFSAEILEAERIEPYHKDEKASRYIVRFKDSPKVVDVKIGLSTTSADAAKANLAAEIAADDSFEDVRERARAKWNAILSRVEAEGDADRLTMLYTALYHLYIQPNNIADIDGKYTTAEGEVRQSEGGKFLTTLSLWDTYRAAHPMYTILTPSLVPQMCASIMDHYRTRPDTDGARRYLPRWALWGHETNTMIGNHAVPVLVDAYLKGLYAGEDAGELYEAVRTTLTETHYRSHVELIDKYGYIPYDEKLASVDDSRETVARLLEGAYDFHCAALLAETLGHDEDAAYFRKRSEDFRNVFDPESRFMRGRNAAGDFKKDVDVNRVVGEWVAESDFTEGNAWHYRFHVQHDVPALIGLMGGKEYFRGQLDSMFYSGAPKPYVKDLVWNIFGTIGQYWHGNEPCHHVPYLYKYTDDGYKADAILGYITDNFSLNAPYGLKGNDDCGQMSALYLFTVMGFYPVNPCGGEFVLGAPQVPYCALDLENGNRFEIRAEGFSDKARFVGGVELNGRPYSGITISYDDIMAGGTLVFRMTERDDMNELQDFKTD